MIIGLEACVIYDGGKKGFEPINHIKDILEFWTKQLEYAEGNGVSLWEEYNARFPLDMYFEDINSLKAGRPELLEKKKSVYWTNISSNEYRALYSRFKWLWTDERINASIKKGSFVPVCRKKINYLRSLIA